jgi:citrate synthase
MAEQTWTQPITKIEPNKVAIRGYRIDELMGRVPFAHVVYLVLKGDLPTEAQGRVMDAILVSSVDHGGTPPSALAARTVTSGGAPLTTGIAAGIMTINQHHGGAIEGCMKATVSTPTTRAPKSYSPSLRKRVWLVSMWRWARQSARR